jgi:hypothetical protein
MVSFNKFIPFCSGTSRILLTLILFPRCEWHTYQQWLEQDIRQIMVETHNAPMPHARNFFYSLHDAGYVIFSKEANFQNAGGGVEFAFLKLSTTFFVNQTSYNTTTDSTPTTTAPKTQQ